jgi:hypothetical protein
VNRDVLNAYLLHQMPEEERAAFSERWEADPDIYDELQMAEADLLDAYVRDSVSPRERSLIEEHLLSSERQLQKLAFAEALHQSMVGPNRTRPSAAGWRIGSDRRRRVLMGVAAAVTVLAVSGAVWMETANQELRREVVVLRQSQPARPSPSAPAVAQPTTPVPDTALYSASLVADDVRGASNVLQIRLPNSAEVLRLELQLESGDENDRYRATLSMGARAVWSEEPVVAVQRERLVVAYVWIPKDVLVTGTYSLALTGSKGRATSYRFGLAP